MHGESGIDTRVNCAEFVRPFALGEVTTSALSAVWCLTAVKIRLSEYIRFVKYLAMISPSYHARIQQRLAGKSRFHPGSEMGELHVPSAPRSSLAVQPPD